MEDVMKQNPTIIPMRLALAERYISSNEFDKAISHINIALSQQPADVDKARALRDMGWILHLQGHSADGAKDLQQSLQLNPGEPNAQFWLAEVDLDGLHDPKSAIPLLESLVQSQQNDPDALKNVQALLDQARAAAATP
jgi:tetratricopeptide (TPR) repeat protein